MNVGVIRFHAICIDCFDQGRSLRTLIYRVHILLIMYVDCQSFEYDHNL